MSEPENFEGINIHHEQPQTRKEREEQRKRQIQIYDEHAERQWMLNHWAQPPRSLKQWKIVLTEAINSGVTLEHFEEAMKEVKAQHKTQLEEQKRRQAQSEAEMQERAKFPNVYKRLIAYITLPEYRATLEKSLETATLEELKSCEEWTLRNNSLTSDQRSLGLAWLNARIMEKQNVTSEEEPKNLLKRLIHEFRGH